MRHEEGISRVCLTFRVPTVDRGFPGGSVIKNPAADAGDLGSIPRSGRSPGEGNGDLLQYSCLGNPTDRGPWWATAHGVAESDTARVTEQQYWWKGSDGRCQSFPYKVPHWQGDKSSFPGSVSFYGCSACMLTSLLFVLDFSFLNKLLLLVIELKQAEVVFVDLYYIHSASNILSSKSLWCSEHNSYIKMWLIWKVMNKNQFPDAI